MNINKSNFYFLITLLFILVNSFGQSNSKKFTVILDAGHGGKDPGNSYHGYSEKAIALKTTLKVGEYLENHKDIEIIYTRKTDVFIELVNRPKIANKAKADLFISIHCNSVADYKPYGTETFVMGMSRSNMNLEVSKAENSVILLEDNYKVTYKGFDPSKPESLMGLKLMQEENLNSSISLASKIQSNFVQNENRKSRGVKQEPLWVLDASYMPGVLIELGFLSNKEEGAFLNSDVGQEKMAKQIADAIISYKKENFDEGDSVEIIEKPNKKNHDSVEKNEEHSTKKDSVVKKTEIKKVPERQSTIVNNDKPDSNEMVYKVQISASSRKLDLVPSNFKGLRNLSVISDNGLYKYFYGETNDLEQAKHNVEQAKAKGFPTSFIVGIKDGKLIKL